MQAPTQEETNSSRKILLETDPASRSVLTHDAAISRLFPRLRLPKTPNPDGTMGNALENFETAWRVIDSLTSQEGFMKEKQVAQLVRLMGYAQTGEVLAGADLGDISNMLRRPGPSCRIYGWTIPEDRSFDESPTPAEAMLADAIMIEGGQYQYGVLGGEAARDVFRRSGLDNTTLATIWELVDSESRGFLKEKGVLRMLRLISSAQRGLRLHARLYENPGPLPDLDDSFISPVLPTLSQTAAPTAPTNVQQVPAPTSLPPSFPEPQSSFNSGIVSGLANPSILTSASSTPPLLFPTRSADDPLPPLTDKERTAFMAIFERNDPQGGSISGAQGLQILSRSQLPTSVLAQIWDLADADQSGSLSRGEFVVAMYLVKLLMDRRRDNPGKEDEQMPSGVPLWLRAEAARMDAGTGPGVLSMSMGTIGGPIGPGGFRMPGSMSGPVQYRPPDGPPSPSLLDIDNEVLPRHTSTLGRSESSMQSTSSSYLHNYLNRPVPPTPPELPPTRSEEFEAPPPYIELDHNISLHARVRSVS